MKLHALRQLRQYGSQGDHEFAYTPNWRFKGLLLAGMDTGQAAHVSMEDVAKAWPQHESDFRFLSEAQKNHPSYRPHASVWVEEDTEEHHFLADVCEADSSLEEYRDGLYTGSIDNVIQHALFAQATPDEVDTLFREQLFDTVIEGARQRQIARDAAFVVNVDTKKGDLPRGSDDERADDIAEGARIRDDQEGFDTVEFECTKHAVGAAVTDEMVDHAIIDLIERQIAFLGRSVENKINNVFGTELVDNAGQNHDASGADLGVKAINAAYGEVDGQDFEPDSFVTHPEFRTTLFDEENIAFANRAGTDDVIRERVFSPLLGVVHFGLSDGTIDDGDIDSFSWGYDGDTEKGAVVYQRDHIFLTIYQDIEIKDYEDPIRDLQGVNARAWTDTVYGQPNAAATIQHGST